MSLKQSKVICFMMMKSAQDATGLGKGLMMAPRAGCVMARVSAMNNNSMFYFYCNAITGARNGMQAHAAIIAASRCKSVAPDQYYVLCKMVVDRTKELRGDMSLQKNA